MVKQHTCPECYRRHRFWHHTACAFSFFGCLILSFSVENQYAQFAFLAAAIFLTGWLSDHAPKPPKPPEKPAINYLICNN